jgi:hypothetical protein
MHHSSMRLCVLRHIFSYLLLLTQLQLQSAQHKQEVCFLDAEQTFTELGNLVTRWYRTAFGREAALLLFNSEGCLGMDVEQTLSRELLNMATLSLAAILSLQLFDDPNSLSRNDEIVEYATSTLENVIAADGLVDSLADQDTTLVDLAVRYLFAIP